MKLRIALLSCALGFAQQAVHALPEVIDNSVYPPSALPANNVNLSASPSTDAMIELTTRLEQLQAEVQQLTGKVEEQANTIAELKKQQSTMYADFDERIQQIENKGTAAADADGAPATESVDVEAAPAAAVVEPATQPAPAPAPVEKPMAPAAKSGAASVSDVENQQYQQAYTALRTGRTDESIAQFIAYLQAYPAGGLAGNAQYWLGEAYRVKLDNDAAKQAFNDVVAKYPSSAKVPDALLKLGYIEMDLQNPDKAREYFNRVVSDYPNVSAAHLAAKKLRQLEP